MTDETMHHGQNGGYEREDLGARGIFYFLIGLAAVCVLVYFTLKIAYRSLDAYDRRHQPVVNPLKPRPETETRVIPPSEPSRFPEPRLENDERGQMLDFRLNEERALHSYGWIDQQAGVVRIPIERAMELTAQRGLPVKPQGGEPAKKP